MVNESCVVHYHRDTNGSWTSELCYLRNQVTVRTMATFLETGDTYVLISDTVMRVFQWVVFTFLCQTIVIFGIITNSINIVCFIKQGFRDAVNVSLFGMKCITYYYFIINICSVLHYVN